MKIILRANSRVVRMLMVLVLLVGGLSITGGSRLAAQVPEPCVLPDAIPYRLVVPTPAASPVASREASPVASPAASPIASPEASPIASPAASPVASPAASPVSDTAARPLVDRETAEHVRAIINAITGCESIGDWETVLRLVTANYLSSSYGQAFTFAEFRRYAKTLPLVPIRPETIVIEGADADGRIRATVDLVIANQKMRREWTFTWKELREWDGDQPLGRWRADSVSLLETPVPNDAARIKVILDDQGIDIDRTIVKRTTVVLQGRNTDTAEHEMLVVWIEPWQTAESLLSAPGPGFPDGVTLVGQMTLPADAVESMILTDLFPGDYTIVDLLPDSTGVPHLAKGYLATFTVTE